MKHFSQFVEYGAVRYDVGLQVQNSSTTSSDPSSSLRVLAFKTGLNSQTDVGNGSDSKSGWVLLAMNLGSEDISIRLPEENMGRLERVVRTSPDEDWVDLGDVNMPLVLPPLSITSVVSAI